MKNVFLRYGSMSSRMQRVFRSHAVLEFSCFRCNLPLPDLFFAYAFLQSNWENHEYQKYFWNVIVPIRYKKTKLQARTLVCGFVGSSRVLIFAVIGHNTINIPEIFQVFTVFLVVL